MGLISGIVILILSLVYIIGAFLSDPEDLVADFEQAVRSGDVEALAGLVSSDDENLTIDEKRLKQFIDYTKENPDYLNNLLLAMRAQAAYYQGKFEKIPSNAPDDFLAYGDYYIEKEDNPLFYDTYSIKVRPYYINIETNEPNAIIKVDGKPVFQTTSANLDYTYGPLMPGIYEVTAEKKFEYVHLQEKDKITALDQENHSLETNLILAGTNIHLKSKVDGTEILVNGKPVGKTEWEGKDFDFGPVPLNGTIKLQGKFQFPWGEEKSDELLLTEETYRYEIDLTPKPFQSQENKQKVVDVINQYAKEWIQAHANLDGNLFTTADERVKQQYTEKFSTDKQLKRTYKGKALGTRIDFDNLEVGCNDDHKCYISIPVEIHALFREYLDWEPKDLPLQEEYINRYLTLLYDENKKTWVVTGDDERWGNFFDGDNVVKTDFK